MRWLNCFKMGLTAYAHQEIAALFEEAEMTIRKISSGGSPSVDDKVSPPLGEQDVYRRAINYKLHSELNTIEESTLHIDLKRRKRGIIIWTSLNFIVILFVIADLFNGMINLWLLRSLQGVTITVCLCNVLYYTFTYIAVRKEANNQKSRLHSHFNTGITPTSAKKLEFVKYTPYDSTVSPTYWVDFHSIFESFKRMTARNRIAFFANDTHRKIVEVSGDSPSIDVTKNDTTFASLSDYRDSLTKYRGRIVTKVSDLKRYFTDHQIAEENEFVTSSEDLNLYQDSTDFWSGKRRNLSDNCVDISPLLRRSEYQNSPSSSESSICSIKDVGYTNKEFFTLIRDRYKIEMSSFIYWISNFRMWLSKTVLNRVIKEINVVDNGLKSLRLSGITIGNVGLETLEDACRNPSIAHQLPSLSFLLPFLRVSTKQHYIVERYRTLSQGSGMGDFKWNVGGEVGGQPWERGYPTDAELIMHLFSTYLDLQLPLSPCNSDTSKPFSSNYLTESIESAKQKKVVIIRQSMNPPHYNLLIDNDLQEIPPGRNNMFYAIVLFLYCIKVFEQGMLGRISLGKHGIDLLWIIEDRDI